MRRNLTVALIALLATFAGTGYAMEECQLSLLNQHLTTVRALIDVRKQVIDQLGINPKTVPIIDRIDATLLLEISETTLKDAFKREYEDPTAIGLYQKNARKIMQEFCRREPRNLASYRRALDTLTADCRTLGCNYCDLTSAK